MDYGLEREFYEERRRKWRRSGFWRGVVFVIVLICLGLGAAFWAGRTATHPHIAEIWIDGVIVEDNAREALLQDLALDQSVRALVVRVSSPGGTVMGSEQLYAALRGVAAQKPVVAVMGEVAASGGLIAALGADYIVARENTLTGSIGVLMEMPDISGLLSDIGVEFQVVRSRPLKGDPSPTRPISPEARAALEEMASEADAWFRAIIVDRRGLSEAQIAEIATGAAFSGRRAVSTGLVDALGGFAEARSHLADLVPDLSDLGVRLYGDDDDGPFGALAGALTGALGQAQAVGARLAGHGGARLWSIAP